LEQRQLIQQIVGNHPHILGMHNLRTRQSGQIAIIQLHLDLNADLTLAQAHTIGKEVEKAISEQIPHADVTIHQDPVLTTIRMESELET
jgi:ferrous-iron efflux pump FieF